MTQADLALKIQVTDKAVSRWERGIGFPDINTIEPLANALEVSVLELMKSERMAANQVEKEEAAEVITDTLNVAVLQLSLIHILRIMRYTLESDIGQNSRPAGLQTRDKTEHKMGKL